MTFSTRAGLIRIATFGVAIAGGVWLAASGPPRPPARLSAQGGYALPEFRLPVLNVELFEDDTTFLARDDLRGHVSLITFWATWCAPCIAEQPGLLALQREFDEEGLRVVGVLHRDSPAAALDWLEQNQRLDLTSVVGTEAFRRDVRVGGLPTTLLVDRRGAVVEIFFGYWPEREPYLRERVEHVLREGTAG